LFAGPSSEDDNNHSSGAAADPDVSMLNDELRDGMGLNGSSSASCVRMVLGGFRDHPLDGATDGTPSSTAPVYESVFSTTGGARPKTAPPLPPRPVNTRPNEPGSSGQNPSARRSVGPTTDSPAGPSLTNGVTAEGGATAVSLSIWLQS